MLMVNSANDLATPHASAEISTLVTPQHFHEFHFCKTEH